MLKFAPLGELADALYDPTTGPGLFWGEGRLISIPHGPTQPGYVHLSGSGRIGPLGIPTTIRCGAASIPTRAATAKSIAEADRVVRQDGLLGTAVPPEISPTEKHSRILVEART